MGNYYTTGDMIEHPNQKGVFYRKEGRNWVLTPDSVTLDNGRMHVGKYDTHPIHKDLLIGTIVKYMHAGTVGYGLIGGHIKEPGGIEYASLHEEPLDKTSKVGKKIRGKEYTMIYRNDENGKPTDEFYEIK